MPPQVQLPQWHLEKLECSITSRMSTLIGEDTQCVHNKKEPTCGYTDTSIYLSSLLLLNPQQPVVTFRMSICSFLGLLKGPLISLLGISHNLYDFQVSILSSIFFLCLILHLLFNIQTWESHELYAAVSFSYQLPSICSHQQRHK